MEDELALLDGVRVMPIEEREVSSLSARKEDPAMKSLIEDVLSPLLLDRSGDCDRAAEELEDEDCGCSRFTISPSLDTSLQSIDRGRVRCLMGALPPGTAPTVAPLGRPRIVPLGPSVVAPVSGTSFNPSVGLMGVSSCCGAAILFFVSTVVLILGGVVGRGGRGMLGVGRAGGSTGRRLLPLDCAISPSVIAEILLCKSMSLSRASCRSVFEDAVVF